MLGVSCSSSASPEVDVRAQGARRCCTRGGTGRPRRSLEVDATDVYWNELDQDGMNVRAAPKNGAGPVRTLGTVPRCGTARGSRRW